MGKGLHCFSNELTGVENHGKIMDMLRTVFCLGFSYSLRKRSFTAAVIVGFVAVLHG